MNIQNLTPIVGCDFVDANGLRSFNFSLCQKTDNGLSALAIVDIYGEREVTRNMTIGALTHFRREIEAMAFKHRERSIPQVFHSTPLPV